MGNTSAVNTQLLDAVKKGEIDKVKQLCNDSNTTSLDINYRDENSATPIMWACYMGHVQIIEFLVQKGGNLTDCDKDGYTALHYAVTEKKENVVRLLVTKYQSKININAKNKQGDTALHRSVYYSLKSISSLLITNGAEINALNAIKETPLDKARKKEMKEWLQSLGAKYNSKKAQVEGGDVKMNELDQANDPQLAKKQGSLDENEKKFMQRQEMKQKVESWLRDELSLAEYVSNFVENGYDRFDAIYKMDKEDLKDIGVKMGHIKIILASIEQHKQTQAKIEQYQKMSEPGNQ